MSFAVAHCDPARLARLEERWRWREFSLPASRVYWKAWAEEFEVLRRSGVGVSTSRHRFHLPKGWDRGWTGTTSTGRQAQLGATIPAKPRTVAQTIEDVDRFNVELEARARVLREQIAELEERTWTQS